MAHALQCWCGTVKGEVATQPRANHAVCYCADCQAYAHFLGKADRILDARGGSEVIQTLPRNLTFTHGIALLKCMRLTERGLLRWYAGCCNTPIGNTLSNPRISFIGLLHSCLRTAGSSLENSFGPVRAWVNTDGAHGTPKPERGGLAATLIWFLATTIKARLDGSHRHNPLFDAAGTPIASPRTLSAGEHAALMRAVKSARGPA